MKEKRVPIRLVALARKRLVDTLFVSCEAGTSPHEAKFLNEMKEFSECGEAFKSNL